MSALPSNRTFVTSLISSLPSESASQNPLKDLSPPHRNVLLTLHVLFPNELLPALDLLDRGLVTRLRITELSDSFAADRTDEVHPPSSSPPRDEAGNDASSPPPPKPDTAGQRTDLRRTVYQVRSAQSSTTTSDRSRYRSVNYDATRYYEVRPQAWSCSCPAFVFSAFPASLHSPPSSPSKRQEDGDAHLAEPGQLGYAGEDDAGDRKDVEVMGWRFGGLSLGTQMPVCKHLLACVLVERCAMFGGFVEETEVGLEEWAGWAAGWGG